MMNRSNGALKDMARQMLLGRYQIPMLAMILATLIPSVILFPFDYLCSDRDKFAVQAVLYYLAYFIICLIALTLESGVKRIHLMLARGQAANISDMFWVFKNRPDRIFIGGFLFTLISWIPRIPSFALALKPLTGLSEMQAWALTQLVSLAGQILAFLITLPFYFIFWFYVDDPEIDTTEAFRSSMTLMRGAKWRLCVMELGFFGWVLLGALSFGIGFLWILPYMNQSLTNFYLEQKHEFDVTVEFSGQAADPM